MLEKNKNVRVGLVVKITFYEKICRVQFFSKTGDL